MIESIELQVISRILLTDDEEEREQLLSFDDTYYSVFKRHIQFIFNHSTNYGKVPDVFTFMNEFQDIETLLDVDEPFEYLKNQMVLNKERIILVETVNRIKDADETQIENVWGYIREQVFRIDQLDVMSSTDIVHGAQERIDEIVEFSKRARIPTGFAEVDKLMYGGFSTVEELVVIAARSNVGKSWVCAKIMESAQRHGFPVLYYSPEMQASILATRFDTWRGEGKFRNSELFRGQYSEEYLNYITELQKEDTPAFILEDKDVSDGAVTVSKLRNFVYRNKIKLLIVDGISYLEDEKHASATHEQYRNICNSLFRMSKDLGCAVVVAMQANRATKNNQSEDGVDPFPSMYELEGSDHPGRIATQVFTLRQNYKERRLDIRLEKSRNASNQKPVLSYSWDPNTGELHLVENDLNDSVAQSISPNPVGTPIVMTTKVHVDEDDALIDDDDFEVGVQF